MERGRTDQEKERERERERTDAVFVVGCFMTLFIESNYIIMFCLLLLNHLIWYLLSRIYRIINIIFKIYVVLGLCYDNIIVYNNILFVL